MIGQVHILIVVYDYTMKIKTDIFKKSANTTSVLKFRVTSDHPANKEVIDFSRNFSNVSELKRIEVIECLSTHSKGIIRE